MTQIQRSKHILQIYIDRIVHDDIFLKVIFYYALTCSVECFICSVASRLLAQVLLCVSHTDVYFQILYNTQGNRSPRAKEGLAPSTF